MICAKEFFENKKIPFIDISEETLQNLAEETVNKNLTIPGVQRKLSMHLADEEKPRLTLVGYPFNYIIKPASKEYPCLPEAEDMLMDIADMMGVKTVPHGLLQTGNSFVYITKRIDRVKADDGAYRRLAMEDFCQLAGRQTADKYKSSYERCAAIIRAYSSRAGFDISEFYLRLIVSFLCGNSDMHLKNFSLIEDAPKSRRFCLSPAYDLLPVNIILPEDQEETALTLCGKKSNLKRENFLQFVQACELPRTAATKMIDSCLKKIDKAKAICQASYMNDELKLQFTELMQKRAERLM